MSIFEDQKKNFERVSEDKTNNLRISLGRRGQRNPLDKAKRGERLATRPQMTRGAS